MLLNSETEHIIDQITSYSLNRLPLVLFSKQSFVLSELPATKSHDYVTIHPTCDSQI